MIRNNRQIKFMNKRQKNVPLPNKKKDVSFTNASDSVLDEQTLAPKFIPGFNVKAVSMVSALLSASGRVINPHISLRTKLTVLHQDAIPIQRPFLTEVRNAYNQLITINQEIKFMNNRQ